jgi:hypothetical protein
LEPTQVPDEHASVRVHALPSLQAVPFVAIGFEQPVAGLHVPAVWHWSLAVQTTGFAPVQVPLWHVSLCVHALPSLHAVPFVATGFEHAPVPVLHVPTVWHVSLAVQVTGLAPVHVPLWHVSVRVHALPSLHAVPFVATGFEHAPVLVLHVPTAWHWSSAEQVTGFAPVHVPLWHVSVCVHALPSLHVVPFVATGFEHVPVLVLHVPTVWHASLAVHVTGLEPVHTPPWQVSLCVQALPSLHAVPFGAPVHAPTAASLKATICIT